ncbi:hypothetical protein PP914_gp066 [Arthrobacter phage Qui]|jgi:hypothetical protein|uniref:Uncharacterized protein n=1 Tax=Arthrobacter phage Qui TaxID=2603260 RepID=A0A5B8WK16_9CAUD|nr:hypothetical protein PP914_gp066 [Arthrobacter phage Qui]QED11556.1 hypothetical protein SEA_QUI_66 [Arthrobacter phage Qui]QOC56388.1 hypothetical protein SEA_PAELLA_66 [Arthrobacter phage Paella]
MKKNQKTPLYVVTDSEPTDAQKKQDRKDAILKGIEKVCIGAAIALTIVSICNAVKDAKDHEKEDLENED